MCEFHVLLVVVVSDGDEESGFFILLGIGFLFDVQLSETYVNAHSVLKYYLLCVKKLVI